MSHGAKVVQTGKTLKQSVHEVVVDQSTTCEDETFYGNGVEVDSCVDCVNFQASGKDEGFVTINVNGKPTKMKVDKEA